MATIFTGFQLFQNIIMNRVITFWGSSNSTSTVVVDCKEIEMIYRLFLVIAMTVKPVQAN